MSKKAFLQCNNQYVILVMEDWGKHRELQLDVSEKGYIDLYTIAEVNRHDRVCDELWFDNSVLWERARYAYFNYPIKEFDREYEVPNLFEEDGPVMVHEHVLFASRR